MIEYLITFTFITILLSLSIASLTNLTTSVDLLDNFRKWFENKFSNIAKLATCEFCQSFWITGIMGFFVAFCLPLPFSGLSFIFCYAGSYFIYLFSSHLFIRIIHEFMDRYFNRVPNNLFGAFSITNQNIENQDTTSNN